MTDNNTTTTNQAQTQTHTDPDFAMLTEIATDIAHSYWDSCAGEDEANIATLMAEHDRWCEIAGELSEGRMPSLSEDEATLLQEWAEDEEYENEDWQEEEEEDSWADEYDNYLTDMAVLITEGNDYDEICQKATDEIASHMGIPTLAEDEDAYDNEEYCHINDKVNRRISAKLEEN